MPRPERIPFGKKRRPRPSIPASKVVRERAGHSTVKVTMEVYAAFLPNIQGEFGKKVDAWLA